MNYKEMLNRCKTNPGWLETREQKDAGSRAKYSAWVVRQNEIYRKEKERNSQAKY